MIWNFQLLFSTFFVHYLCIDARHFRDINDFLTDNGIEISFEIIEFINQLKHENKTFSETIKKYVAYKKLLVKFFSNLTKHIKYLNCKKLFALYIFSIFKGNI